MTEPSQKMLILGSEHDGALRQALRNVLAQLGAKGLAHDWGVGGSQELEAVQVLMGVDRIVVEAETFIGLSIRGPVGVVDRVGGKVAAEMNRGRTR